MLEETAIVANINGDVASITTQSQLSCSSCQMSDSCGNGIIEKYLSGKVFTTQINNSLNATIGDQVVIAVPKSSVTKASLIVYFIPILVMFLFMALASFPFVTITLKQLVFSKLESETILIVCSLLGLAIGFLLTNYYNAKRSNHEQYQIKMVRIVTKAI